MRGLDYYTRTVFEIQPLDQRGQSTICGGGRYDGLIETRGGKPTPGIGFGLGIERLILNIKKEGLVVPPIPYPTVYIAHIGEAARIEAIKLAASLRRQGVGVIAATSSRSLKAQLRQANNIKATKAVIIGEDEVRGGTVILRDMASSEQKTVPVGELAEQLK